MALVDFRQPAETICCACSATVLPQEMLQEGSALRREHRPGQWPPPVPLANHFSSPEHLLPSKHPLGKMLVTHAGAVCGEETPYSERHTWHKTGFILQMGWQISHGDLFFLGFAHTRLFNLYFVTLVREYQSGEGKERSSVNVICYSQSFGSRSVWHWALQCPVSLVLWLYIRAKLHRFRHN